MTEVKLWVYVTGHSFTTEEGVGILVNETVSLFKRKNPYPLQATLADACSDNPNLSVMVLNDCCIQPFPDKLAAKLKSKQ